MAFQPGNKSQEKLTTPELRQKVYEHYCRHLEKGKDKRRWYYDEDGITLIYESLTYYFERYPSEFDPIKRKTAECKGFQIWEEHCEKAAIGKNKEASIPGLNMVMRNKYGWDKEEHLKSFEEKKEPVQITIVDGRNSVQPETG